ncbi:hypothetical protein Tco_1213085 [Tanacetum coccineum]
MVAVVWRWCHGGEWGGSRKGERRVAVRGIEDRVDPVVRNLFGFGQKSLPEKFSGGGGDGRRWLRVASGGKKKQVGLARQELNGKLVLVDDDGKPFKKGDSPVYSNNDSEIEEVFNETASFMVSTSLNSGNGSSYGHDMSENLQAICDVWDIKVRGLKKK